jgi:hypothetical protein
LELGRDRLEVVRENWMVKVRVNGESNIGDSRSQSGLKSARQETAEVTVK